MKTARVLETSYDEFANALRAARAAGRAVFPEDKAAWRAAVAARAIKAEAFRVMAEGRFGAAELVILEGERPWEGLFAYDPDAHVCVRYAVMDG